MAWAAAQGPTPPSAPPIAQEAPVIESIEETTVGDLAGVRVAMANVFVDRYVRADGAPAEGLTCLLVFDGQKVRVGAGSAVSVAGRSWEVVSVTKAADALGEVVLRAR